MKDALAMMDYFWLSCYHRLVVATGIVFFSILVVVMPPWFSLAIKSEQGSRFCKFYSTEAGAVDLEGRIVDKHCKEIVDEETAGTPSTTHYFLVVECQMDGTLLKREIRVEVDLYHEFETGLLYADLLMYFPGFPLSAQLKKQVERRAERECDGDKNKNPLATALAFLALAVFTLAGCFCLTFLLFNVPLLASNVALWFVVMTIWFTSPFVYDRFFGEHGVWWAHGRLSLLYCTAWKGDNKEEVEMMRLSKKNNKFVVPIFTGLGGKDAMVTMQDKQPLSHEEDTETICSQDSVELTTAVGATTTEIV